MTKRYLVFDAGCSTCTELSQAIHKAASGKLEIISIHDQQAQGLLDQAYPDGWGFRPYLVELESDKAAASTGIIMALRLGLLLGLRQAWHVWKLARQHGAVAIAKSSPISLGRRTLLKYAGALWAALILSRFQSPQPVLADHCSCDCDDPYCACDTWCKCGVCCDQIAWDSCLRLCDSTWCIDCNCQ